MKVLITGARAPAALELIRLFAATGAEVGVSDCVARTLTQSSKAADHFLFSASPRFEFAEFRQQILNELQAGRAELVIPTCEEVFYLAKIRDESGSAAIFCDDLAKLEALHDKFQFTELAKHWPIQAPVTEKVSKLEEFLSRHPDPRNFVFKPVFSRFATHTMVGPSAAVLRKNWCADFEWVAQQKIVGREICLYSVGIHGRLTAFAAYVPKYRAGQGAGIGLEPYFDEKLVEFCREFYRERNFHGQAAFDVMWNEARAKYFVLECNPRATSGVHFFGPELVKAFTGETVEIIYGDRSKSRMVAAAMLVYAMPAPWRRAQWSAFWKDYAKSIDVVWDQQDPWPFWSQYVSFAGFVGKALWQRKSPLEISSQDFEYNG